MTHPLTHLLLFVLWTLLMLVITLGGRGTLVLLGKRTADAFPPYSYDPSRFFDRAARAYQNCLETLPVFGALVLASEVVQLSASAGEYTLWILLARMLQSSVHLVGAGHWLVMIRFTFFLVQVALMVALAWYLLTNWWPY